MIAEKVVVVYPRTFLLLKLLKQLVGHFLKKLTVEKLVMVGLRGGLPQKDFSHGFVLVSYKRHDMSCYTLVVAFYPIMVIKERIP